MRKLYLFFWLWFIITIVVNAQSSTETFETESQGSINFTDNGVVFNIISHKGTFNIYRSNGWGWSGTSADNQFIDNNTLPTANASFSIKTTSNLFRMNRFWIYLSDVYDNQSITGTLTIVGKLNGVTKYSTTKTSGFNTDINYANGHTLIDLTNLNGQNYSNIVIDELVITAGGDYAYMGLDAFTWVKYSNQPTVTTDATVTNLGAKTVTVGGSNTDDGTTISARGIVWSTTANPVLNGPGVTNVAATTNGSGAFTINATSLPAATTLYYRAYATNAAGTAYGDVKSFTTNPALSATQSQTIACNGVNNGKATVVPSGGKSPYTYSWSPSGGNGATATGLSPNNYTVTITDNEGTFITKTFTIAQNPAIIPGFITITDVSYYGGNNGAINISPLGGSGSYTYNWGGGITTQNRSNLTAGTYSVTITDDNGCTFTINNLQVTQPASIPAVVSSIKRRSTNPTNANTVEYNVEFSKDVTGVSTDDFTLTSIGNTIGSISNVTGSGTTYTVTITGLSGDGTIRLDLNNGTGIKDADNNAVSGFTSGEIYTIDHTAPSVSGVTNNGIYNTNRTIIFSEGTATLNGSSFSSGSVVSSEGHYTIMVTDNAGNTATVNFVIDKTAPIITSLSVPPNTTYTKNQQLYFIVNFSEAIDLTAVPTISIEIGTKTVQANYVSLPNTSSLTFRYIVQRSDYDADGIKVKSLNFNEGSIKDFAGNDANLTLNGVGSTTGVLVDARESDLAVVSTIDKPISELNETVNFTVTATNLGPDDANNVSVNITLPQGINFVSATPSQGSYNNGTGMWSIGNINEGETKHLTLTSQVNTIGSETLTAIVSSPILDPNPSNNSSSATVNIDKKSQQITFNPFALITYGDVAKPLTATSSSGLEITYTSSDPTIAEVNRVNSVWIVTPKAVGQVNIIASQIGNNEYVTAVSVTQALTIIPAALTITADSKSKVYGSTDPTLTYQITSGKLIGTDQLTGSLARDAGENVGNYPITQGTLAASPNYNFTYQKADFDITKASLTVTADAQSKVYGTNDPSLTYQITSGKLIGTDQLTGSLARYPGENVGNYPITQGTLAASTNYNFTYQKADLAITPASLTVTADSKSKVYGTNNPSLTYQITSGKLIGTDQLTGSLARDAGENVGNYTINQGTLNASSNYDFIFNKADFDITKAGLTVTADSKSKVYGSTDPALTYQITAGKLIGTDQLTGSLARDAGENVGNYPITQGTLAASPNYNLTYQKADFAITKASLAVTADAKSKVYGSTDPTLTYQITSGKLIGTDQLTGSLARDAGENVGNYPITQGTLAASPNYNFTYQKADLAITPASLTVTADSKSKVYGSTDPTLTYQITSGKLIGTDQLTGSLARDAGENVGNYTINQGTLAASPNYNFTYQKADLAITKASLTVTADSKSKVYGTNDPSLTYQITSGKLIGTDQLTGSLARDAGENVGNYPITQGTLTASANYDFTYKKADFAITKASLVGITFNDNSFTYDGTNKSLAITGTLPKDVGVSYVNNNQSQAGTYTVTANITGGNNYQDQTLTADLTINKATQVITWTQDLTIGCDGENTLVLNATASSDLPVYYTSSNSTIATVIGNSLTFNKQGSVDITAQQDGNNNYLPATHVIKQVNMRLIGKVKKKWEDVLIFDNSSDDFVSWQWYKDGQAIVGAQGQYYTSPTPLNGSYMVVVKDKDGNTMETCPLVIVAGQHKGGVKVVPNPARQGTTFTIKADYPSEELKGAKIMITDITGKLNKEINQVSPEVVTQVPMVPGIYIIYLFLENGKRESVKLLVN
ncbi:MBG domain-containing protein [Empedobacter sp. ULE_I136]